MPDGVESVLENGSRYYGRAFRLYSTPSGKYQCNRHPAFDGSSGYLGMTKPEAEQSLSCIAEALWAVARARRESLVS